MKSVKVLPLLPASLLENQMPAFQGIFSFQIPSEICWEN